MTTLFLTGFMGAGKTTIGQALSEALSLTLFDTDELIETALKKSIKDIFKDEGEESFRKYEQKILQKVSGQPVLITTGGGMVTNPSNRHVMRESGLIIYLHSDPATLLERLKGDTTRPLLEMKDTKAILNLFEHRLPYYLEADYVVNTAGKSIDTIVTEIIGFLSRDHRFWA
ncbi:shikimate kinase [Pullulanibacillus sp. KACC 23026]|uniref:shikimate kinase n=1 Tax=Pullulanibacillus sp. KACC 23026 TaxID=3028315 RepID=UPI0023AF6547|nr:shikimate kinase [Pullulanibacillus sp. KACC 23026]WEG14284.1 shikimate kinase [Pullulanibacillus sp. KACC 23026]